MRLSTSKRLFVVFSFLVSLALGSSLALHEKRDVPIREGHDRRHIEKHALLPMRVGLKHNNNAAKNAEKWLMDISHPDSPNYGRHWSQEDVIEAFQPTIDTILNVTSWLHNHGITEFTHSDNKLWFAFDISVGQAESMLETEYFEHATEKGEFQASCDHYYLPKYLQAHVDYVTPGIKESDITGRTIRSQKSTLTQPVPQSKRTASSNPLPSLNGVPGYTSSTSLANCHRQVTPACIQALYNFSAPDPNLPVSPHNAMGIFESLDQLYSQPDLDLFYENFVPDIPIGTSPLYYPIDGSDYPITYKNASSQVGNEANLDIQMAMPIIYPQNISVFEVLNNHGHRRNFGNRFLDAIDGSYCTYEQRGNSTQGGLPRCGILKPTTVISISYGYDEILYSPLWLKRQCNEYLKLGLQGVSFFVSSGDIGVGSIANLEGDAICLGPNGTAGARVFSPGYPASCPWVTAVGATQIRFQGGTVNEPEVGAKFYQFYNGTRFRFGSSGGGFSLSFDAPEYQSNALSYYFKNYDPSWPYFYDGHYQSNKGRYNRNGRGFPDISANGNHLATTLQGSYFRGYGTSASTPIVAALFNRINEERIRIGKGPLGFINPTLYKYPEALNDIVEGGNGICTIDEGFEAAPGWDPVTGLGTPNYGKLLDIFLNLL